MALLTENFTFEAPLSARVREAIAAAFDQGWADPKKLNQASHRALSLRTGAIEEFAHQLQVSPGSIEVTGEPHLLHHLALQGFLTSESHLYISPIDVGKIRAVGRIHPGATHHLAIGVDGEIELPQSHSSRDVISVQSENGETGIKQKLDEWRSIEARVILDGTRTIPSPGLADNFAAATFDAQSWDGPTGLGFLLINDAESYRYPLAHIAPIRVPGSYSLPLLVGAVIALEEFKESQTRIYELRNSLADKLKAIEGVAVVGSHQQSRYLSAIVDGYSGEEVLRTLLNDGTSIDSGSACSPEDLAPSHVIGALGLPTTGHLRFTLHSETSPAEIDQLTMKLKKALISLSR